MDRPFQLLSASGANAEEVIAGLVADCNSQASNTVQDYPLAYLYVTDAIADQFGVILEELQDQLDVKDWVGTVGMGICCSGQEYYDEPAAVVLLTSQENYQLVDFAKYDKFSEQLTQGGLNLAVVHGNPHHANFVGLFENLGQVMPSMYFVGGLISSRSSGPQALNGIVDTSLSGVLYQDSSHFVVSHTQGCTPMENQYLITKCKDNIILEINQRPALEVFKEAIGEVLAKDLNKIAGYIFAGFPISNSDTNDYLVRNIIGFDIELGCIVIGDYVSEGQTLMFCRRDGNSAIEDMERMLENVKARLSRPAKGALYFSCLARGRNQFGVQSEEMKLIQKHLGDLPLVGFYANGEILHNRLYGYTGVLTVFT